MASLRSGWEGEARQELDKATFIAITERMDRGGVGRYLLFLLLLFPRYVLLLDAEREGVEPRRKWAIKELAET